MFQRFSIFVILMFTTLHSNEVEFPQMIDFAELSLYECHYYDQPNTWTWQLSNAGYEIGLTAFNGAPELGAYFAFLKKAYQIDTIIETGTFRGATTCFFANCFNEVHTIELNEFFYLVSMDMFQDRPHVHCHFGSSEKVLKAILPSLKNKPLIFYLDAHWYNYWPLFDEIEEISKTHKDNCIIVIDDFKVPNRSDLAFDRYKINGVYYECSYESIKNQLDKVFTDYSFHYIIPKNPGSRAKFVGIPSSL